MLAEELKQLNAMHLKDARLLLVDDQETNLEILDAHLSPFYKVFRTNSGENAVQFCELNKPDLVVMDVNMPGMDGLSACRIIKSNPELNNIPILFATSLCTKEAESACWNAGGSDFIVKPVTPETLLNRVKSHLSLKFKTDFLQELVFRDGLTGVYNKRYFDEILPLQLGTSRRKNNPISLLMVDIDHFKKYNDNFGHLEGDDCLKLVAKSIKNSLHRPSDIIARFGGEEFVCLLPDTDSAGALCTANRILAKIAQLEPRCSDKRPVNLTVSIGIATVDNENAGTDKDIIQTADCKLYQAKKAGRNRVFS